MIAEQRLISQIRDFVNGLEQEPSTNEHDLAEQFAELCRSFNARLEKCDDLLEKGLRSEAVQEALSPPSLFQLRELLETHDIKKWRNMCLDFGMTAPPELDFSTVDRLRQECSTEQLLQPLLRKFRRLVHEGTREERIQVLRQLRVHDPDNPVWIENLEPLERTQLQDIDKKIDAAIEADDVDALRDIYEDLSDPRRLVPPPDDLLAKAQSRLQREREENALAEGEELSAKLKKAHEDEDFEQVEKLMKRWQRLASFADFHPTDEMQAAVSEANRWYQRVAKERETERRYQQAIEKLRLVLDRPNADRDSLEQAWDHVRSFNKPVAEGLEQSVPERIDALREQEERRRRTRRTIITVCTFVAIAILGGSGWYGWNALRLKRHLQQLRAMWSRGQTTEMAAYLDRLEAESPGVYEEARVQDYAQRLSTYVEDEKERTAALQAAMTKLDELKAEGYAAADTRVHALIREAEKYAETDAESRQINEWERDWKIWKDRQQAARDDAFNQLKATLTNLLDGLESEADALSIADLERQLDQAGRLVQEGTRIFGDISPSAREGWEPLTDSVSAWRSKLATRKAAIETARLDRIKFLRSLDQHLQDLTAYKEAVTEFLAKYPDIPEAADLQRAVDHIPAYRDALNLNDREFPAFPMHTKDAAAFSEARGLLGAGQMSVWYRDLSTCIEYPQTAEAVRRDLGRIRSARFWDWKELRYRKHGEEEWNSVYTPDAFLSREQTADDGTKYMLYWGEAFQTSTETYKSWLERVKFDSREYEVQWDERVDHNLIPAAQYGRRLLASVPRDQYIENFLLDQITELIADEELEPVAKAELIFRLTEYAATAIPFEGTGIEELRESFEAVDLDIPWINTEHPRVKEETARITARLRSLSPAQIQKIRENLEFNRWLLVKSLNRGVRIAGIIKKDLDTNEVYPEVFALNPDTLRCMLPGREGVPNRFYVLVRKTEDGDHRILPAAFNRAFPGQILAAPADGDSIPDFLEDAPHDPAEVNPDWPANWPVNEL